MKPLRVESACISDIGRRRTQNQDRAGAFPQSGVLVVADGMGGHRGGEIASQITLDQIAKSLDQLPEKDWKDLPNFLTETVLRANSQVYQRSRMERELEGMGTTVTLACLYESDDKKRRLLLAHVGDSRAYYFSAKSALHQGFWQLTRDHSLVQEKLRAGMITRDQIKTDRMRNVIMRSVGYDSVVQVDLYDFELPEEEASILLLCSDGLSSLVNDEQIQAVIWDSYFLQHENLARTAQRLVDLANELGGDDNVSVALARVLPEGNS